MAVVWSALLVGCRGAPSPPADGHLARCGRTPNCVSSQSAEGASHHIEALSLHGDAADATQRLAEVLRGLENVSTVAVESDQLRATFVMPSGAFTDDLDLVVDAGAGVVHVRSSSRIGIGDLGVNRARVEALRETWASSP